jgi:hypothetical protein
MQSLGQPGHRWLMLAMVGTVTVGKTMLGQCWPNTFKPTVTMPMLDQRWTNVGTNCMVAVGQKVLGQRWPNGQNDIGPTSFANVGPT